jgi:hypothetical protein
MQQSPSWEVNIKHRSSRSCQLIWNPKDNYHVHKSPPLVPILNPLNSTHTLKHYFRKIHFNITLTSTPRSSEWSLPFRLSNQHFVSISNPSMGVTCPAHLILLQMIILIIYVKSTNYGSPGCAIFSSLLSLRPLACFTLFINKCMRTVS